MKRGTKSLIWLVIIASLVTSAALFYMENAPRTSRLELTRAEHQWLTENAENIRVAPVPNAPPVDFTDAAGRHLGVTPDFLRLVEHQLHIRFQIVECESWKEVLTKLENREIDLVGSVQDTPERRAFLSFTEPYLRIPTVVVTTKDRKGEYHLNDLQDLDLVVVDGSALHTYLMKAHPEYILTPVENAEKGFQKVSFGGADAMVTDLSVASYYIEELGYNNLQVAGDIKYPWELRFASRSDWPELNSILNKVLHNIPAEKKRAIRREWIKLSGTIQITRDKYLKIVGGFLIVTLLLIGSFMFWNQTLRKQVTRHSRELGRVRQSHANATRALGESEERFRVLVESSNDMIWEMDQYGTYLYVSPRAHDILGYEADELVGKNSLSLMTPPDSARNMEALRRRSVNSTFDHEINTYFHKTGRRIMLESSGMAFADNKGELAGFRGVSRDITERVESENAMRRSEERFRNLVETTSDWIWEVDIEGNYTYSSPQASELLGYAQNELLGSHFTQGMPPEDGLQAQRIFDDALAHGAPIHSLVSTNRHKDGRTVMLETSTVPFYDKEWNIQGYRGISRDITDRITAEKQLEFERNLFRSFMEHAPDLIYFKDREGRFIEVNAAKAEELRLSPEDLIGRTDFDFLPEDEARARFEDETQVMSSRRPIQKEERATTPDGARWYLTTKVPRYDEEGEVIGTFGTSWNITYRKQAEEQLRRLRALLSNTIDSMPSILVGVDAEGLVIQWNREAETATGAPAETAVGTPLSVAFPELHKEMVKVERAIRERATLKEERIPSQLDDGRTRYHDITVYPLLEGDVQGAVIRVDDVTDRVMIEDSIRNIVEGVASVGRRFFNSMVDQLAKTLDADVTYIGEFIDESHEVLRTIAVSADGATADNFEYPLPLTPCEAVLKDERCAYFDHATDRFPENEQLKELGIDSYIGIPLMDSENHALGVMVALYRKPVERVEFAMSIMQVFAGRTAAELERLQATKELVAARNLLENIINSTPSILVGVDAEGRVMQWNTQAEELSGIEAAQAQGQPLDHVFPDLGKELNEVFETAHTQDIKRHQHVPCVIQGEPRVVDATVYPITNDGSHGAVIRMDDVTDRVRIEEMMVQSEKMMSVGGLAAGMAHEINNPLAGILQNLQVMRNRVTHETDRNISAAQAAGTSLEAIQTYMQDRGLLHMMDSISEAGRRAAKIVDNMLSFSRKDGAHFAPNNLEEIIERSIELASNDYNLKKRFDFRHIKIIRDFEPLEPIPCEGSQIQQVLLNLLSNSAQAMAEHPDETREPRISIRLKGEAEYVLIEIEDNGPGMDPDTRKRAFEPFFTTKDVGHGTGLGLSVSYFIITENHGGTMNLISAPGKGAKFSFRIPYEHRMERWGLRL